VSKPTGPSLTGLAFLQGDLALRAERIAAYLAESAVERDRAGGTAKRERDQFRSSGLLRAWIPVSYGGLGASWPEVLDIVRLVARVDSSLAHLFGFQHLILATLRLFGSPAQFEPLFRETAERELFWGNALNPLDKRTLLTALTTSADELSVSGQKSFCSGSVDADRLLVSATDAVSGRLVVFTLPSSRPGIRVFGDWNSFGQRQTDSGGVEFDKVKVDRQEVLSTPGPLGSTFASIRPLIAQLVLTNVYLGIAEGAFGEAKIQTRARGAAWPASGVERPTDDSYILLRYGEVALSIEAARVLSDRAALSLQAAYQREDKLTPDERGQLALDVAAAKVTSARASLDASSKLFELSGPRATDAKQSLDRFWRNARVHTLHDPVDYKLKELGSYALVEQFPTPSFYS
jgi:alkylation response protein AidB-like acyl-CoA dehydrogenase